MRNKTQRLADAFAEAAKWPNGIGPTVVVPESADKCIFYNGVYICGRPQNDFIHTSNLYHNYQYLDSKNK